MRGPKVLLLDIETAPNLVWAWSVYDSNAIAVKEHWYLLSFSAKWLGGKSTTLGLPDFKGYRPGGGDKLLTEAVWKLLDEADIVIAHNGKDFDLKKLTARFIVHGLPPPSPYKIIDTKDGAKRAAAFASNKLDWLCKQLELGKKMDHEGFPLWEACMNGDARAWGRMKRYNRHDVVLLEQLYNRLAPWINQPNAGAWGLGEERCPNVACGSQNLEKRGLARNNTRAYQRFQCRDCGAWGRAAVGSIRTAGVVAL